jgi:uncharacterized linocin/CFP29 family protein
MNNDYLQREDAPFGAGVWAKIDETVVGAAASQLTVRRLIEIEGPYGLGLKALTTTDEAVAVECDCDSAAIVSLSPALPVPTITASFALPARDLASFEQTGLPFDLRAAADAALACARQEDDLLLNGLPDYGVPGLLTHPGAASVELKPWAKPGDAFATVLEAVNTLDGNGLHGPYALALAPARYNGLFRLYPDGGPTEMEQLQMLVTGGLIKAPALTDGGVLVAVGKQFVSLVVGQDLATAYMGPLCGDLAFCLRESLVLRVSLPGAICVIGS